MLQSPCRGIVNAILAFFLHPAYGSNVLQSPCRGIVNAIIASEEYPDYPDFPDVAIPLSGNRKCNIT